MFHRHTLPRLLLLVTALLMPLLILPPATAENRDILPDNDRQHLSDFYHYLRSRYGRPPQERNETQKSQGEQLPPAYKQPEQTVPEKTAIEKITIEKTVPRKTEKTKESETRVREPAAERPEETVKRTPKEAPARKELAAQEQAVALADTDIVDLPEPIGNRSFSKPAPATYRGLYINNAFVRARHFPQFLKTAKDHGINTLVIDIQPRMPETTMLQLAEKQGFYLVARVVVFEAGLKTYPAPRGHIERIVNVAEAGAKAGFAEIQLDYIRFADNLRVKGLTLQKRYAYISTVLKAFEDRLRPHQVRIGADIFGRISFNRDDIIGQKLEVFDRHLDVIYPMLYPSHFYGDPIRRRKPYHTIYDGTRWSKIRVKQSRIVPYIQAFGMKVGESGLSVENYIRAQLDAAQDSGGGGYIAWNARNDYSVFFSALRAGRFIQKADQKLQNRKR